MQEWTKEEVDLLLENFDLSASELEDLFDKKGHDRTKKAISRKKEKIRATSVELPETEEAKSFEEVAKGNSEELEAFFSVYDKELGKKAQNEARIDLDDPTMVVYRSPKKVQRYVHLCDLHLPFQIEKVEEIIENEKNPDTILIINGDFLDCFDVSIFPKAFSVGLSNEVKMAKDYLRKWSRLFKAVYIVQGNHEHRLSSFLRKKVSADVISLITDDIIEIILNDLKINNIFYRKGDRNNWYIQVDNVIIAHPIDFKGTILATAQMVMNYFDARNTSANVFMIGHTHAFGKAVYKGRTLVEGGCLCKEADYAASGKLNYMPQTNGYIRFTSNNGIVSFNDIELITV